MVKLYTLALSGRFPMLSLPCLAIIPNPHAESSMNLSTTLTDSRADQKTGGVTRGPSPKGALP